MKTALLLARAWSTQHKRRTYLVTAAIAVAMALIVFTTTSYQALLQRSNGFAKELLGRWDLVIMPQIAMQPQISEALETALNNDERCQHVMRSSVLYCDIEDAKNTTYYETWRAACIATIDGRAPMALAQGEWANYNDDAIDGVLSGGLARRWRVGLGAEMPMHSPGGTFNLRIVGITDEQVSHGDASGVFVHPDTLKRLSGAMQTTDRLYLDLQAGVNVDAFMNDWQQALSEATPAALAHDVSRFAQELSLDKSIKNLRRMSAASGAIILLAALFIVYAAMAAGSDERRRQLALLRCIGALRSQVFATVCIEALCLAFIGTLLGLPFGILLLELVALVQHGLFGGAVWPSVSAILIAVFVVWFGVFVAALLPAYAASRTKPLQVMAGQVSEKKSWPWVLSIASILLLTVALCFIMGQSLFPAAAALPLTVIGLLCLAVSALCMVRPLIVLLAAAIAHPIAAFCKVPYALLRMEHDGQLRRAGAMILVLSVCLGFSVMMNVWGRSMVTPFLPSPQLPDQVISILPAGVPPQEQFALEQMQGITSGRLLPMRVEQTLLGDELIAQTQGHMDEIYVQILGLDPQALDSNAEQPLLPMASADAAINPATALQAKHSCIVPTSFGRTFNLAIGDEVALKICGSTEELRLPIAAFASLPGWQWVTKMGRMRSFNGKPVAPIVVSQETAAALGISSVRHWLADTEDNLDMSALRTSLQSLADRHAGDYESAHFGQGSMQKPSVKIIATGEVARRMQTRSAEVIWVLGAIPLSALLIAILGIVNAVAAGIRERQWQLAIMRSVGLEGRQSLVLIIAEVAVVAVLACVLSVVYGILAAWAAIDVSLQLFDTGTSAPPIIIPWLDIVIACVITLIAALLAAYLPAKQLRQAKVVDLLREGRAL